MPSVNRETDNNTLCSVEQMGLPQNARGWRAEEWPLLAAVFEAGYAIFITDADMRILKANAAACAITGYPLAELVGNTPKMLSSGRHDPDFYRQMWYTFRATGGWQGEVWNRNKQGDLYAVHQSITAVRDAAGNVSHYISMFHPGSSHGRATQQLPAPDVVLDHLTGALDRHAISGAVTEHLRQAELGAGPLSFLLFNVDHFKAVNDKHGHERGDCVLKEMSILVRKCLRTRDVFGRWGGEEFAVLLPETPLDRAGVIAERLCLNVANTALAGLGVTISVGLTRYQSHDSAEVLWGRAAQALRRAKRAGRNRVACSADGHYW